MLSLKIQSVAAATFSVALTVALFAEAIVIPVSATGAATSITTTLI